MRSEAIDWRTGCVRLRRTPSALGGHGPSEAVSADLRKGFACLVRGGGAY
jgi:hypothetical protein